MKNNPHIDCWLTRIEKVKTLLKLKRLPAKSDKAGAIIDKIIKSKFDKFYLDQINKLRIGNDGQDHNKLRFYKKIKGSLSHIYFRLETEIKGSGSLDTVLPHIIYE